MLVNSGSNVVASKINLASVFKISRAFWAACSPPPAITTRRPVVRIALEHQTAIWSGALNGLATKRQLAAVWFLQPRN
jgi:hypothetical protein